MKRAFADLFGVLSVLGQVASMVAIVFFGIGLAASLYAGKYLTAATLLVFVLLSVGGFVLCSMMMRRMSHIVAREE